jgi:hypothetical protein
MSIHSKPSKVVQKVHFMSMNFFILPYYDRDHEHVEYFLVIRLQSTDFFELHQYWTRNDDDFVFIKIRVKKFWVKKILS